MRKNLPTITIEDLVGHYVALTKDYLSAELNVVSLYPKEEVKLLLKQLPERVLNYIQGLIIDRKLGTAPLKEVKTDYLTRVERELQGLAEAYGRQEVSIPTERCIKPVLEQLVEDLEQL